MSEPNATTPGCSADSTDADRVSDRAMPGRRGAVAPGRLHSDFKARLLDAMARSQPLSGLGTRADDDPAVALADAWAAALHVLSFSVERYHGQSYIDTADDIRAVDGLARMVGYEPRPAISASTTLTFAVDATPGAAATRIPQGSKVQTVPAAGEEPVLFETATDLDALPRWNELTAQRRTTVSPKAGDTALRVDQILILGRPGDVIAVIKAKPVAGKGFDFVLARIDRLEPKPLDATRPGDWIPHQLVDLDDTWVDSKNAPAASVPDPFETIAVFSRRASFFGYNAPTFRLLAKEVRERILGEEIVDDITPPIEERFKEWPQLKATVHRALAVPATNTIDLDAVYPEAFRGRYILLVRNKVSELFRIDAVEEVSRTDYAVTSRVSRLTLDRDLVDWDDHVRDTSVLIQTESLTVAQSPVGAPAPADAEPDTLAMAADCDLPPGRVVVAQGVGTVFGDSSSAPQLRAEVAVVKSVGRSGNPSVPSVVFTQPLRNRYDPQTLVVLGNAVAATHGETKMAPAALSDPDRRMPELLGSGDARLRYQAFPLRQGPLTHVGAANPRGYEAAIEVRVDGERRPGVGTLFGQAEQSQAFALEATPDGGTAVRFAGRLPTAPNNVGAIYRVGGGSAGNLEPGRLTLPLTMPLGLRSVTNPVPTGGGVDREGVSSARRNAPIRVVTLDRIVSLGDYEAFALAYGGISKAVAELVWTGGRQLVHLTVAGPGGAAGEREADLFERLRAAILAASVPGRSCRLSGYTPRQFTAVLALLIDPAFVLADVERGVQDTFATAFGAERRRFGEPVAKSRMLTCAQGCRGVVAATVVELRDHSGGLVSGEVLGADGATDTTGAQLLTLAPGGLTLRAMAP